MESLSAATGAKFALLPPDNATGNFTKVVQRVPVRIAVTQRRTRAAPAAARACRSKSRITTKLTTDRWPRLGAARPPAGGLDRASQVYRASYLIAIAVTLASVLELIDTRS